MAYLDTSVLAAYYCPEPLSDLVSSELSRLDDPVVSPLVQLELVSALGLKVRRRELALNDARLILAQFDQHLRDAFYRIVGIGPDEYELADEWLGRLAVPLRTLDALHLAAASASAQELWTADKQLARAALRLKVRCRLLER